MSTNNSAEALPAPNPNFYMITESPGRAWPVRWDSIPIGYKKLEYDDAEIGRLQLTGAIA